MNIWIVGGGSLGLLFAARLAKFNSNIKLLCRTYEQAQIINSDGVRLSYKSCDEVVHLTVHSIEQAGFIKKPAEIILLTIKQYHLTAEMMNILQNISDHHTQIFCFQNGIGHQEKLKNVYASDQIKAAITTEAANRIATNHVIHTGKGKVYLNSHPSQRKFIDILISAGFEPECTENMEQMIWNKLLINAVINPLTAILGIKNGMLLQNSHWKSLMFRLYLEAISAVKAAQQSVHDDLWDMIQFVCEQTADNESSMLQDINKGVKTEIDWINGQLLQIAERHQISLPFHEVMYRCIKGLEEKNGWDQNIVL